MRTKMHLARCSFSPHAIHKVLSFNFLIFLTYFSHVFLTLHFSRARVLHYIYRLYNLYKNFCSEKIFNVEIIEKNTYPRLKVKKKVPKYIFFKHIFFCILVNVQKDTYFSQYFRQYF